MLTGKKTGESLSQTREIETIMKEWGKKRVTKKAEDSLKKEERKIIGIRKQGMCLKTAKKGTDGRRFNIYKWE